MQDRRSVKAQTIKDRSLLGGCPRPPRHQRQGACLLLRSAQLTHWLRPALRGQLSPGPNARYCFYTSESRTSSCYTYSSPKAGKALLRRQWAAGTDCVTQVPALRMARTSEQADTPICPDCSLAKVFPGSLHGHISLELCPAATSFAHLE